ncbi:serine aminopeptidase domain-containing protein [Bradyrhizobium aeschynomenes]|uniref:serine aminopeptidase domain-containing protein n=1 Tax=Bradyrhizobium aeschynomenes TaxID=2734909 RepID=UPI001556EFE8|nr:alpha/beta hydrolase [Bradyrhizobium aeschynomenes]NPV24729.1 alpha/beta hydrolase [Bradyrhizobium aeschynomenes]
MTSEIPPRRRIAIGMRGAALLAAALAGLACCVAGIWQLEAERTGVTITSLQAGTTPITVYRRDGAAAAPVVVIAHGFAGSRQFMEAYALTLAHAGYLAVSFDFEGHGRNPVAMSGDVTRVDGTTRKLMSEIGRVTDAALSLPGADGRVALLGHSMASDIIVRQALADPRIAATVAISMFSEAATASAPRNLLIITGEWETSLRQDALRNLRLADSAAQEGDTVGDPAGSGGRRAVVAPGVEHVSVLYSTTGLREARDWLDRVFGRSSSGPVAATGGAIALLLAGIVLLAWPLAELLPKGEAPPPTIPLRSLAIATLVPAVVTPIVLRFVETRFLPVLVADYLAVHLFVYGALSLLLLRLRGVRFGRLAWLAALALAAYGIAIFGGALDRYVASFMPIAARVPIIAAIAIGAVPYMLADSIANQGGHAALWRTAWIHAAFLASLGGAVALDFKRLFFLLIIIPVIVLFFIVFGLIGGSVGRRTCSPLAEGIGLGLILAWSLGVSFPMFLPG